MALSEVLVESKNDALMSAFVDAMAAIASPVSVMTTDGPAGRYGQTASAVSSVSVEPPTVLVSINKKSPSLDAVLKNHCFCLNFLSPNQIGLANSFAGRSGDVAPYHFSDKLWGKGPSGAPTLQNAVAFCDCKLLTSTEIATHIILFGKVIDVSVNKLEPLAYCQRKYQSLVPIKR